MGRRSNLTPQRAKNTVNYCEWFVCGVCGTEVAFDIKQVSFTVSSLFFPRPVSCSRQFTPNWSKFGQHFTAAEFTEKKKWSHEVGLDRYPDTFIRESAKRAAKDIKISCLPRESSLNHSWPSWILPQAIRDLHLSYPWFLAELDYGSKSINISTCIIHRHPGMPGYKKHNRLRMSSILHSTDFAYFLLIAFDEVENAF